MKLAEGFRSRRSASKAFWSARAPKRGRRSAARANVPAPRRRHTRPHAWLTYTAARTSSSTQTVDKTGSSREHAAVDRRVSDRPRAPAISARGQVRSDAPSPARDVAAAIRARFGYREPWHARSTTWTRGDMGATPEVSPRPSRRGQRIAGGAASPRETRGWISSPACTPRRTPSSNAPADASLGANRTRHVGRRARAAASIRPAPGSYCTTERSGRRAASRAGGAHLSPLRARRARAREGANAARGVVPRSMRLACTRPSRAWRPTTAADRRRCPAGARASRVRSVQRASPTRVRRRRRRSTPPSRRGGEGRGARDDARDEDDDGSTEACAARRARVLALRREVSRKDKRVRAERMSARATGEWVILRGEV